MWPLKRISSGWFKVDPSGKTIYFPFGVLGSGYVVRDAALSERVNWLTHLGALAFALILGLHIVFGFLFAIVALLCLFCIAVVTSLCLVRGLVRSSEHLTAREYWSAQSPWFMVIHLALALFALVGALAWGLLIASGQLKHILTGVAGVLISGATAAFALARLRLLYTLWRERREGAA